MNLGGAAELALLWLSPKMAHSHPVPCSGAPAIRLNKLEAPQAT